VPQAVNDNNTTVYKAP